MEEGGGAMEQRRGAMEEGMAEVVEDVRVKVVERVGAVTGMPLQ
jgi:hypothetical protein